MDEKISVLQERQKTLKEVLQLGRKYMACRGPQSRVDYDMFASWINAKLGLIAEGLDNCPSCNSNPDKVPGGCPCKRCGMIGLQPWGG